MYFTLINTRTNNSDSPNKVFSIQPTSMRTTYVSTVNRILLLQNGVSTGVDKTFHHQDIVTFVIVMLHSYAHYVTKT